jgi:hypothetical protein
VSRVISNYFGEKGMKYISPIYFPLAPSTVLNDATRGGIFATTPNAVISTGAERSGETPAFVFPLAPSTVPNDATRGAVSNVFLSGGPSILDRQPRLLSCQPLNRPNLHKTSQIDLAV